MNAKLMKTVCKAAALSVTVGAMLAGNGIVANAQPKEMKDGTVFDAEYYAQRYADVTAVYGTDETSLFQHYTDYGKSENREAVKAPGKETFDADYYAGANPDVTAVYGTGSNNLYQHYLQYGKEEGRSPVATAGTKANTGAAVSEPKTEAAPAAQTVNKTPTAIRVKTDSNGNPVGFEYAYD